MGKIPTERRVLKKELSLLKHNLKMFPMLSDCSKVSGDDFYNEKYKEKLQKDISKVQEKIDKLKKD